MDEKQELSAAEMELLQNDTDIQLRQDPAIVLQDQLANEGQTLGQNQRISPRGLPKFAGKKLSTNPQTNFQQRHSPLAFQVKKSLSKKNLRMSPTASSQKLALQKSPSLDHSSPNQRSKKSLRNKNGQITMSHRAGLNMSMARNSNRGIVTMSSRNGRSGTLRVKSARRKSSALSNRSTDNLILSGTVPLYNEASNSYYDKNLGKQYDRFNSQYRHEKNLQEIMETDRSTKSRLSSGKSRTKVTMSRDVERSFKKNRHNHTSFVTREHSNEINRKNERLFNRLQEIHSKKRFDRSKTPTQFNGQTSISSPTMGPTSLNFPSKKREAARIDQDNYKFAQRIMNQKPQVVARESLNASHKKKLKTLRLISSNARVSINDLVNKNEKRFAHVKAPLSSTYKLPPLRSPSYHQQSIDFDGGLAKKKIVPKNDNRRTKSLVRNRPSQTSTHANVNFAFASNKVPKGGQTSRFTTLDNPPKPAMMRIADPDLSQTSNIRNSEKRKVKRQFRPKASSLLGLNKDDLSYKEAANMLSSVDNSSIDNNPHMDAKLGRSAGNDYSPELAHPPVILVQEQHIRKKSKRKQLVQDSSQALPPPQDRQENYYASADTQNKQNLPQQVHMPDTRQRKPIKAKKLPTLKDVQAVRQAKHDSITPTKRISQKHISPNKQKGAASKGQLLPPKPKHFHQKHQSMMQQQPRPPHEDKLQLSKMAINTDSSQMLYPDFTHNMQNMQSIQVNHVNNTDYYDIAEIKAKYNKKRKKDGSGKYYSRVTALNQTDYSRGDNNEQNSIVAQPHTTRNRKAGGPNTVANSHGEEDPAYMIFEQTHSDNQINNMNGMHYQKQGAESQKPLSEVRQHVHQRPAQPFIQVSPRNQDNQTLSPILMNTTAPLVDDDDNDDKEPTASAMNASVENAGNAPPLPPLKIDPNNSLPFILQKQQLHTKSKEGRTPRQSHIQRSQESPTKHSNQDLKSFK